MLVDRIGAICVLMVAISFATDARQLSAPQPREPISGVMEAFKTHELVAISDPHGNAQTQTFLRALVGDPRFADAVNDIVVEVGSARYQDLMDRYVRGESVSLEQVRPAWQNTTVPNQIWADETLFASIRAINATRPPQRRLRVLLGDPPIDWDTVRTREEHFRWLAMRDSYPASVIQLEVLAKRRKALIVYGHLHFQRYQILSNLDMSDWRTQTIVSLIERSSPSRVFTIWRLDDELAGAVPDLASWPVPAFVTTAGTALGAADISVIHPTPARFAFRGDERVPVPREQWASLPIEKQFDAVLYLGPRARMTGIALPVQACGGPGFVEERVRRITVAGVPAFEADNIRKLCANRPR